jgi:hypothetical protein
MRFKVTGGADGVSGIEVAGKRYEAGDDVELTAKQAEWLVDAGYLEPLDGSKKFVKPAPAPAPAPEPEPTTTEVVADEASDDAGSEF